MCKYIGGSLLIDGNEKEALLECVPDFDFANGNFELYPKEDKAINIQEIEEIKDKIKEYLDFDKKYKTYTKDGRENFSMEYFKAKALQELLEK